MADGNSPGTPEIPATETRGGENPDWARAKPGQALPEKEQVPAGEPGGK